MGESPELGETTSQFVESSGFIPCLTASPPNINGFTTWQLSCKLLNEVILSHLEGRVYDKDI